MAPNTLLEWLAVLDEETGPHKNVATRSRGTVERAVFYVEFYCRQPYDRTLREIFRAFKRETRESGGRWASDFEDHIRDLTAQLRAYVAQHPRAILATPRPRPVVVPPVVTVKPRRGREGAYVWTGPTAGTPDVTVRGRRGRDADPDDDDEGESPPLAPVTVRGPARCSECQALLHRERRTRMTCSDTCRQRRARRLRVSQ